MLEWWRSNQYRFREGEKMKDRSLFQNVKILGELKLKRSHDYWLIHELIEHDGGDYWRHIATIGYKIKESNIALYERAQRAITEGEDSEND
jgi:hypothetical protein